VLWTRGIGLEGRVPETVEGPAVFGPDGGAGVPELRLQELASRVDEAAAVGFDGGIVAGERAVEGAAGCAGDEDVTWRGRGRAAQRDLGEEAAGEGGQRTDGGKVHD
jgi:hypothetical protein